jgi:transcriptional regulator with XRE-family HTH domain
MATTRRRTTAARSPSDRRAAVRHRGHPDPLAARVGQRIRQLRKAAEFTFDAFVEETSFGRGYLSELERGLVVPTIGTVARVARALELTIADLVIGDTERERLFEELCDAPATTVRELRERARAITSAANRALRRDATRLERSSRSQ